MISARTHVAFSQEGSSQERRAKKGSVMFSLANLDDNEDVD